MDLVPQIKEGLNWINEGDNKVTLEIENKGIFNKIAQRIFKKPKISYIHLDELGSFVWLQIDGAHDINSIGIAVKENFGEKAEPIYERVIKYFEILKSYDFVEFIEIKEIK